MTWKRTLNHLLWGSLDWLFPPVCAGCGKPGYRWCPQCRNQVEPLREPLCRVCGQTVEQADLCRSCKENKPAYESLRSWAVFEGPVRQALHSLKYKQNAILGEILAVELAQFARELQWEIDLVVPVPSGRKRLKERGYNQVALLAAPFAGMIDISFSSKTLLRSRETATQVGLNHEQRRNNVAGAFRAVQERAAGKNILILDDVATTGATLDACAGALRQAGAGKVYALTLARALPRHGFEIV